MTRFLNHPIHKNKVMKFLYSGGLMRGLSIVLNYIFADLMQYDVRSVYMGIMVLDFFIGFSLSRFYVFNDSYTKSHKKTFIEFVLAGVSFRVADWLIYVSLVEYFKMYILFAQVCSILIIMVAKFLVYKKIFK